jgi:hypothetical protein
MECISQVGVLHYKCLQRPAFSGSRSLVLKELRDRTTVQRPSAGTEIRRMFSPGCERFNMRQERGGLQFTKAEY